MKESEIVICYDLSTLDQAKRIDFYRKTKLPRRGMKKGTRSVFACPKSHKAVAQGFIKALEKAGAHIKIFIGKEVESIDEV